MREVSVVEVPPLLGGRVPAGVEEVGRGPVVVGGPLVEVVRDVEGSGVRRRVFEIDDNDL